MAEDDLQYNAITTIKGNLEILLPEAAVCADMFWYPVEGRPDVVVAPDVFVALGRPRAIRGCYKQWEEAGVAPQVVFEVWSKSNRWPDKARKLIFYGGHGVEEFYTWDPHQLELEGFRRGEGGLEAIADMNGWVSPLLGVRFALEGDVLALFHPDGRRFFSMVEIEQQRREAEAVARTAQAEAAEQRGRAEAALKREAALRAQLMALGVDPDAV